LPVVVCGRITSRFCPRASQRGGRGVAGGGPFIFLFCFVGVLTFFCVLLRFRLPPTRHGTMLKSPSSPSSFFFFNKASPTSATTTTTTTTTTTAATVMATPAPAAVSVAPAKGASPNGTDHDAMDVDKKTAATAAAKGASASTWEAVREEVKAFRAAVPTASPLLKDFAFDEKNKRVTRCA